MSLPENISIPSLSECQFYHENPPAISFVHRHATQAAQVSQHTNSTSPLPSPLHQLHRPQVGGQQSHMNTLRSNSYGSFEPHKIGFKHNQGCSLQGQNRSQVNFSPQRRVVPQSHNTAPGFRNQQQQYNSNSWRRKKRDNLRALNQSRWKDFCWLLKTFLSPSWHILFYWGLSKLHLGCAVIQTSTQVVFSLRCVHLLHLSHAHQHGLKLTDPQTGFSYKYVFSWLVEELSQVLILHATWTSWNIMCHSRDS